MEPIPEVDLRERSVEENIAACALELLGVCRDIKTYFSDQHALTEFALESKKKLNLILQLPPTLTLLEKRDTIQSLVDIHNELMRLLRDSTLTYNEKLRFISGLKNSEELLEVLISQYDQVGGSRRKRQTRRLRKRRQLSQRRRRQ